MSDPIRTVQTILKEAGFDPGPIDGVFGTRTADALRRALAAQVVRLVPAAPPAPENRPFPSGGPRLPWIEAGLVPFGWHEVRDRDRLMAWLRSDGRTLGDPSALPWCGDYVETAIRLALPNEPFPGALGVNPYWARNWVLFGRDVEPSYGAVVVFERGSGGHVGFAVGQDATHFHVLGGNQGDSVNVARIDKRRLIGCRWPITAAQRPEPLPMRDGSRLPTSANEV